VPVTLSLRALDTGIARRLTLATTVTNDAGQTLSSRTRTITRGARALRLGRLLPGDYTVTLRLRDRAGNERVLVQEIAVR
jgi:hypothetical protein